MLHQRWRHLAVAVTALATLLFVPVLASPAQAAVSSVDDSTQGAGLNQFNYSGTWTHCSSGCQAGLYNSTQSWTNTSGGFATILFSGVDIKVFSLTNNGSGIASVQICDASLANCGTAVSANLYSAVQTGNNQIYDSGTLASGTHSLKISWTGTHDPSSSGNYVNVDRVAVDDGAAALTGTYYIDNGASSSCSNAYATPTSSLPWCDFTNLNGKTFGAGAQILLKRGDTWSQELGKLYGGGSSGSPVTIGAYGSGARPIISGGGNAADRGVWVENGDYWTVSNLEVKHAGMGIVLWYTSLGHEGLQFRNLYLHDIKGVFAQSPAQSDLPGLYDSTGLYISGSTAQPTSTQWVVRNIVIDAVEATDTNDPVDISGMGGFLTTYPNTTVQNVTITSAYWHNNDGCPNFDNISNVKIMSSRIVANGSRAQSVGTTNLFWWYASNFSVVNSVLGSVPNTSSPDMTGTDFEAYDDHGSYYGNYIAGDAGPALEYLALGRSGDYNNNHVVADNAFTGNTAPVWSYNSTISGTARDNIFTESAFFTGTSTGWTTSNNVGTTGLYSGGSGYSGTQGANAWSYQIWNGSAVVNLSYDSTNDFWGTSGNYLSRFDWQPAADASRYTIRTWTAPHAGTVNVRGRIVKNQVGGDGVSYGVTKNGSWFTGYPATLGASDQSGVDVNLSGVTVAAGDQLQFQVNAGSSGNSTNDLTSWNPIVAYT